MLHNKISKLIQISLVGGFFIFASSGLLAQSNSDSGSFLLEDGDRIEDVDPGYLEMQAREKAMRLAEQKALEARKNSPVIKKSDVPTEGPMTGDIDGQPNNH